MSQRMLLIYNPRAGKGSFSPRLGEVVDMFVKGGYEVMVHPTQGQGDAVHVVRALSEDIGLVVAAGGDGTLDEVVNGLMMSGRHVPIGYIPVGSTNDFASSLGLSSVVLEAVGDILGGEECGIDIGDFNGHYFIYVAAFGAFTDVSYETDQDMKNVFGHVAYLMEGARRIGDLKTYRMTVTVNGETKTGDYIYGMVTNSTSVGGIKGVTGNDVRLDDGLMEVTLVRAPRNIADLNDTLSGFITGTLGQGCVDVYRTTEVIIESETPVPWTLDGEYGGSPDFVNIKVLRKACNIILDEQKETIGVLGQKNTPEELPPLLKSILKGTGMENS